jgi:hypothetical protein
MGMSRATGWVRRSGRWLFVRVPGRIVSALLGRPEPGPSVTMVDELATRRTARLMRERRAVTLIPRA